MYKLRRFGIKLGLDLIGSILTQLGNPHQQYNVVHIAGTNGKGSVAAFLSSIFNAAGYNVGRYTSPHLERFNERICINGNPITDTQVVFEYQRVKSVSSLEREPTFFEFATAMALDLFAEQRVEWAIVETGMGGRLDATNIISPKLSIITNISLEHKEYLGNTIAAIAREKAGIIKPGTATICGAHQPSARNVIKTRALRLSTPIYFRGQDYRVRKSSSNDSFSYYGIENNWPNLQISLVGKHQIENASHALAACELLNLYGLTSISEDSIRKGLINTNWPGRLEIVSREPLIILDGAHNLAAARSLSGHLSSTYPDRRITMVVGILDDKPFGAILRQFARCCHRFILTQPAIGRALPARRLYDEISDYNGQCVIQPAVGLAVKQAIESAGPDEIICIAGSLYVVGEAKSALSELVGIK